MALINENLLKLSRKYIFPIIEERRDKLKATLSTDEFVDLGVGDISYPITKTIIDGLKEASDEIYKNVIGYGPSQGYLFLRDAIVEVEYKDLPIQSDEIFVSEGINSDICGIQELFSTDAKVGIIDPAYPVYYDLNIMAGRESIIRLPLTKENHFIPNLPSEPLDIVYLTNPSNPTGVAMTRESLQMWVDWARENKCIIFYDAAYAGFIKEDDLPRSIYEIEGADEVAVEFKSFSKSSGFTGVRLGYCVIPHKIEISDLTGKNHKLNPLWMKRQSTKTNGVSYPIQKAGLAALSLEAREENKEILRTYMRGTQMIVDALTDMGFVTYGGINCPYIWWKVPGGDSWKWFEKLIEECHIISVPGKAFGAHGEGYVRLSGFVTEDEAKRAAVNLSRLEVSLAH